MRPKESIIRGGGNEESSRYLACGFEQGWLARAGWLRKLCGCPGKGRLAGTGEHGMTAYVKKPSGSELFVSYFYQCPKTKG